MTLISHLFLVEPGGGVVPESYLVLLGSVKLFVIRALLMFRLTLLSWFPRLRKTVTRESFEMLADDFSEF